ncbi:16S rRNA (uracil(1498)-N(3))-methyltransferase [Tuberibacillus sp. Marseille-P3662]|uniref:16S rRNA (uracil(1498)-N(3))-methyltransferase n=1 Tax=Tuberibacillus sp. Marseille-P3662 TaxID=1965358 RepID=UPI000A1CC560|nr:16S rRNA (uracil(1498)-N(3))-methyltransferase [Tuberibacillus sp. Marseille-P3662]
MSQRYFIPKEQFQDHSVIIQGEDARHIRKVMRMTDGETITCCDNDGHAFLCKIRDLDEQKVIADILEEQPANQELDINITVVQGMPKSDKLEWVVQKGTELGVNSFVPFTADRSIVKWPANKVDKKVSRLQKIAKESAEQSHRVYIPEIIEPWTLQDLIQAISDYDSCVVAYEEEGKRGQQTGLPSVLNNLESGQRLLIVIGPEGGLSKSEVDAFQSAGGVLCGLGSRILRTETAPLFILSAIAYQLELLSEVK